MQAAQASRPSLSDSFRLGSGAGILCRAQSKTIDPAITTMFDRSYALVCRDAAEAVGRVHALRAGPDEPLVRLEQLRQTKVDCSRAESGTTKIDLLGNVNWQQCTLANAAVGYRIYQWQRGKTVYVAEGLSGYDNVLQLALRTIVADRFLPGEISVATTMAGDPAAFARVQAGTLEPLQALNEGYRRNNGGNYVEASEFFDAVMISGTGDAEREKLRGEYLVNRALQRSNLGDFAEADALFAAAAQIPTSNQVQLQLRRNFLAIHLLNQGQIGSARAVLAAPIRSVLGEAQATLGIDQQIAGEMNGDALIVRGFAGAEDIHLTPDERSAILDGQAMALRGTALRMNGDLAEADIVLQQAITSMIAIREGRVSSIARMRTQAMGDRALIAEAQGRPADAEQLYRDGITLLETEYPSSQAVSGARLRLAAFLTRNGKADEGLATFAEVIGNAVRSGGTLTSSASLLVPYFDTLAQQAGGGTDNAAKLFEAAETLVRPGVADTLSVLARELSGGNDDAARMFRQSVNQGREIERTRIDLARLSATEKPTPDQLIAMAELKRSLNALEAEQTATLASLSAYPRYRAVTNRAFTLAELQQSLAPDEAYYRMADVSGRIFAWMITRDSAHVWKTGLTTASLDKKVDTLRETISTQENGQQVTYAFDAPLARTLYLDLFGPVDAQLQQTRHLIFEPDGAMLRLPVNLLIAEQAGVDAYQAKIKRPGTDEFDFTGIAWLGRTHRVSTSVAARAFTDARKAAGSASRRAYLGMGNNAPVSQSVWLSGTRSTLAASATTGIDCRWPVMNWDRPISARELETAQSALGASESIVLTGAAFNDTALRQRTDLNDYRILHFATHGLVTAPRPECPARPALLTSFGDGDSDGLLGFAEIYDLKLDADVVILSACDTAGKATVAATREAGVATGGGDALDGLVRAFIGAGSRSVIASHWPAPDEYNATERLISGLFKAAPGTSIAAAMQAASIPLMDDPATSHPFYWSGFAVIGDGSRPVQPARQAAAQPVSGSGVMQ